VQERWQGHPGWNPQPIERWLTPKQLAQLLEPRCRTETLTTFFFDFDRAGVYGLVHRERFHRSRLFPHAERRRARRRTHN
jgi:hypothetical protein